MKVTSSFFKQYPGFNCHLFTIFTMDEEKHGESDPEDKAGKKFHCRPKRSDQLCIERR